MKELYASLKSMYKRLMFPAQVNTQKWTMSEIDSLDVHFFYSLMDEEEPQQQEVYLSDIW